MPFDPVAPKQSLPDLEEGILQYWREEDTFKRSIRKHATQSSDVLDSPERKTGSKKAKTTFSFYDGPPFATGLPHYGHLLAGTIKDVIPRYQTMRGKTVQRRFGWDCHGLPIENIIEKEHDIKDKQAIEEMGIGAFNDLCRSAVQRHASDWRVVVERMGRWVDMDWDYKTMDPDYMESIWWVFAQLHKKDLIYEGFKSMHICPRCATPLSNFEVTLGYKDVDDVYATWKFALLDEENTSVLAWTTTPWSTLSTMGLAIGPEHTYVKVKSGDEYVIFAKDRLEEMMKHVDGYEVVDEFLGSTLVGRKYEHIVDWYGDIPEVQENPNTYHIFAEDYVDPTEGTGLVTINGAYGEIDMEAANKNNLPILMDIDMTGHFNKHAGPYAGMFIKDAQKRIIEDCKKNGRVWDTGSQRHSYPHCWRCDSALMNYSTASWFVAVDRIKDNMLKANSRTEWVPSHLRDGRFGRWLENARDWAISRNRYWGTPLPIWRAGDDSDFEVIGSRDDLMKMKQIRFTKITALRHAESEGNLVPIYQGQLPGTNLTKRGKAQSNDVGMWLKSQNVDIIYCSPLARTIQTAEAIAKKTGAKVVVDERLREVEFGEWEGKAVDFSDLTFIKERRAHKLETGKAESIYHFDGMESWKSVGKRMNDFIEDILPRHRSEHVVIVTHADPMVNLEQFFAEEEAVKLSHRPYPEKAIPKIYYWDHDKNQQLDLHKDTVDDITWPGPVTDKSVEITMIRHGETDWNKQGILQGGDSDIPLNETGKDQMRTLAKKLKGQKYDCIVSSDLKRTRESAEILSKELGIPLEEPIELLRERRIGNWAGKTLAEVNEMQPAPVESTNGVIRNCTPEGGESFTEYLDRVGKATDCILGRYAGKKVLMIGHRGLMQFLKIISQNLQYKEALNYVPDNGSIDSFSMNPRFKRIPEVLDCWFESGSMPYAQEHFPFEMKHKIMKEPSTFPANFIAEGMDQTRGWFYTLTVLGAALFGKSPFENCVVNGTVLAEDGKKMSKRLKNYPDPMEVIHKHGADAVRFALMSSPAVRGEDLRFSEKIVSENVRSVMLPLWNTYSFFVTYANAAKFEPVDSRRKSEHPLDVWILSEVQDLANRMTKELDNYDLSATCAELHETIDALTNWYIRLSRRRFAGKGVLDAYPDGSGDAQLQDQHDALMTLYDVLLTLSQLLAPFCPFITEAIYLNLVTQEHGSVHLTDWPLTRELSKDEQKTLDKTRVMRLIVSLGNSLRAEAKVKVRQPLQKATIALPPEMQLDISTDDLDLLRQELNVKEVDFAKDPEELAESFMQVDARKVGPKLGKRVQEIIQAGKDGNFTIQPSGEILILDESLSPDEVKLTYRGKEGQNAAADRGVVISMNTDLSDALLLEGDARDIIRGVQRVRKETGLEFMDEITLAITGADEVLAEHKTLIESETRSTIGSCDGDDHTIDVGEKKVTICFIKR